MNVRKPLLILKDK